jgi:hypothetical protein
MCKMTECDQTVVDDKYQYKCNNVTCQCVPGATFCGGPGVVINLVNSISGATGDFVLSCPTNGNNTCKAACK